MIFYFSGTGNSLYVARKLLLPGEELINIAEALREGRTRYEPAAGETVGFVLPTYFYGIPETVKKFIGNLGFSRAHSSYGYLVLTCGGSTGAADTQFRNLFQNRGYELTAWFGVEMPDNFFPLYRKTDPGVIARELERAESRIAEIRAMIARRELGDRNDVRGRFAALATALAQPFYTHGRGTRKFKAGSACTHCGKCARICPESAIEMSPKGPVWIRDRCAHCFGCLHRCPVHAIEYGPLSRRGSQYIHPALESPAEPLER